MWTYLLKRLLVMVPTLFGILTLTFLVTQFVPGGPVEHVLSDLDGESGRSGGEGAAAFGGWTYSGRRGIDGQQVKQLTALYGFDRPPVERYLREVMIARIAPVSREMILSYIAERVLGLPKSY